MNNGPNFQNPLSIHESITKFHDKVEELFQKQPTTLIGLIYRKLTFTPLDKTNEEICSLFNESTLIAKKILEEMEVKSHKFLNLDFLREKLRNNDFQIKTKKGGVFTHKDLEFFCNEMDRLFKKIYPHVEINPFKSTSPYTKMPKIVQNFFSPELKRLREDKQKASIEGMGDQEKKKTQRKIAKGGLAINLGRGVKANKGATGTLIIKDINGKPVGIHKVSEKDVPLWTRIKNIIKSIFGGQLSCLSKAHLAQPRSERAAYLVSRELGFGVAPSSLEATIQNKVGVFQVFVNKNKDRGAVSDVKNTVFELKKYKKPLTSIKNGNGEDQTLYPKGKDEDSYIEAEKEVTKHIRMIDQVDKKGMFYESELILFQKFAIFDYLIGNLDRHGLNWLITVSPDKKITSIRAVDNANAFPKKQPAKNSSAAKNQYAWKSFNIAEQEFTHIVKQFVKDNLNPDKIKNVIKVIKEDLKGNSEEDPGFLDNDMEELFIKRANVIFNLIEKNNQSPATLANISTLEEMESTTNK